jgi:putative colanic acid biosynthesis glycosyltransferase
VQTKRETQLIPEVSVITVVKNDSKGLQKTMSSLFSQTILTWECLIISARSEDDTQTVANEIADSDDRVLHFHESKPGIYEAMNQGLELAKAPAIVFMNAGDIFAFTNAIEVLNKEMLYQNCPIVIGGYSTGEKIFSFRHKSFGPRSFSLNTRWGCHQSMILRKSDVISCGGFSLNYQIASDFELVLKMLSESKGIRIREVVSVIEPNGISSTQIRKVLSEKQEIRRKHFGKYSLSSLLGEVWTLLVLSKINLRSLIGNHH